jgi:hypothetical protein
MTMLSVSDERPAAAAVDVRPILSRDSTFCKERRALIFYAYQKYNLFGKNIFKYI